MSDPTATGPDGKKIVYRNGAWQPFDAAPATSASEPTATGPGGEKVVYRAGKWQPWSPNFDEANPPTGEPAPGQRTLQRRLNTAATAAAPAGPLPQFSLFSPRDEFTESVGAELARLPGRFAGALGDIIGAAKPIGAMIGNEARKLTGKEPLTDLSQVEDPLGAENIPTSQDVLNKASEVTGVTLHEPKGPAGAAGTVVAGFIGGPKLAAPAAERATVAATAPVAAAKTAAPTLPEMSANTTAAYNAARDAGITVKARPFSRVLDDTIATAEKEGNDFIAKAGKRGDFKKVDSLEKAFKDLSKTDRDEFSFEQVDRVRRKFNRAFRKVTDPDERRILTAMKNKFDEGIDAMTPGADYTASNMAPEEAAKLWKDARATNTAEQTAKSVDRAFGGDKTAAQIQKQAQKWLDDPRRMKQLKPEEQDLVREIANVGGPEKMANLVSRITGGPLGSFLSFHFLGPVGAAPAVANVAKAGYAFRRGRRAGALREIVRGYGPEPTPAGAAADVLPATAIPEPAGLPPVASPPWPWLAAGEAGQPERPAPQ